MPDIDPELQAEQLEDAKYLEELNHYVNTLSAPSAESVALYRAKLSMLEDIHTEIRAQRLVLNQLLYTEPNLVCLKIFIQKLELNTLISSLYMMLLVILNTIKL